MTPQPMWGRGVACVWAWPGLHVANSILVIKFFAAHKFGFNALSAPPATDSGKFIEGSQRGHSGGKAAWH